MKPILMPALVVLSLGLAGPALAAQQTAAKPAQPTVRHHWANPNSPAARQATQALNLLESKGYGSFSDFHPQGDVFVAKVTQKGAERTVTINPATSQITEGG